MNWIFYFAFFNNCFNMFLSSKKTLSSLSLALFHHYRLKFSDGHFGEKHLLKY